MPIGCLICDEALETPAPVPVADPSCPDAVGGVKVKKTKTVPKRPPATVNDNAVTPCGHIFHELCLDQWFKNKSSTTCPVCRKSFTKAKLIRVFPSQVEDDMEPTSSNQSSKGECSSAQNSSIPKTTEQLDKGVHAFNNPVYPTAVSSQASSSLHSNAAVASYSSAGNSSQLPGVIKFADANHKWSLPATTFQQQNNPSYFNVGPSYAAYGKPVSSLPNQYYPPPPPPALSGNGDSLHNSNNSYYKPPQSLPYHFPGGSTSTSSSLANQGNGPFNTSHQPYDSSFNYTPPQIMPYAPALPSYVLPSAVESSASHRVGDIRDVGQLGGTRDVQRHGNSTTTNGMGSAGFGSSSMQSSSSSSGNINSSSSNSASVPSTQHLHLASNSGPTTTTSRQTPATGPSARGHSSAGSGPQARTSNSEFNNKYEELNVIHQTLVADYNELQQKYNDSKDEVQLLKAQLESSKDEIKRLQESTKRTITKHGVTAPEGIPANDGIGGLGLPGAQKRSHNGQLTNPGPGPSGSRSAFGINIGSQSKQVGFRPRLGIDINASNSRMPISSPAFTFINPYHSTARDQMGQIRPQFPHLPLDPLSQRLPEAQQAAMMNSLMSLNSRSSTQSPVLIGNSN